MTNKKLENILVVEDNPKHIEDAKKYFNEIKEVNVYYVSTYSSAVHPIGGYTSFKSKPEVDGVITDIYLPIGDKYVGRKGDEDPIGLLVAATCHKNNIPFVFCTAGYHHGEKYNWINMFQRTMEWPEMLDASSDRYAEADHKPWDRAYKTLKNLVEKQPQ